MAREPKAGAEEIGESRELQTKVGVRIKEARMRAGLSQGRLATAMQVTTPYISLLETGKQNMTLQTLERVARILNTDVGSLLPVGREGGITPATVVDLLDGLTALATALRGRVDEDQQVLAQIERVLTTLKVMHHASGDSEKSS
jgi:HTH-type transcriptional regulator / antitoxin HipB